MREGDENEECKWDLFAGFAGDFEVFEAGAAEWPNRCHYQQLSQWDGLLPRVLIKIRGLL